jgi:hypothetical protein
MRDAGERQAARDKSTHALQGQPGFLATPPQSANGDRYHTPQVNLPATRGGDPRGPEEIAAELRRQGAAFASRVSSRRNTGWSGMPRLLPLELHRSYGKRLTWDAQAMQATKALEADQYLRQPCRSGWELPV